MNMAEKLNFEFRVILVCACLAAFVKADSTGNKGFRDL
jgi:hypothetical protein